MERNSLSLFLTIGFMGIMFFSCSHLQKKKANPGIPPKYVQAEPQFKKEGILTFYNKSGVQLTTIDIEKAETDNERSQGLMYRSHMEDNQAMLFLFEKEERQAFWMKNTEISLDIIFVNAQKEVVHIAKNTKPYSTESIPSFEYAQYVVEVKAGFCDKNNIEVECKIDYQ